MRIAYFDCFSGASGDMILAACIDAGVGVEDLRADLAALGVEGYQLEAAQVRRQGFRATQVDVRIDPAVPKPHRHLKHIRQILQAGRLPEPIVRQADAIFTRLAEAEASVHGTTVEKVHFHEVGAIDAIVDVTGACLALARLGVQEVRASAIPTGHGSIRCDHGLMPVPAPATAELLKGVPLAICEEEGELITPTGAAILTTLAKGFGPLPAMVVERIGIGMGRREGVTRPNVLRLMIGTTPDSTGSEETDEVLVLEVNLDDVSSQVVGYVSERLLAAGARDVFTTPIYMKKNRPATLLTVLAEPALRGPLEDILFTETSTFGIRSHLARRSVLSRLVETVETELGPVRMKIGRRAGSVVRATPEFEDCRELAHRSSRPLLEVMELARKAWERRAGGG